MDLGFLNLKNRILINTQTILRVYNVIILPMYVAFYKIIKMTYRCFYSPRSKNINPLKTASTQFSVQIQKKTRQNLVSRNMLRIISRESFFLLCLVNWFILQTIFEILSRLYYLTSVAAYATMMTEWNPLLPFAAGVA